MARIGWLRYAKFRRCIVSGRFQICRNDLTSIQLYPCVMWRSNFLIQSKIFPKFEFLIDAKLCVRKLSLPFWISFLLTFTTYQSCNDAVTSSTYLHKPPDFRSKLYSTARIHLPLSLTAFDLRYADAILIAESFHFSGTLAPTFSSSEACIMFNCSASLSIILALPHYLLLVNSSHSLVLI